MTEKAQPVATKKKSWGRRIIVILLLLFIGIQFFQPDKNNTDFNLDNDISKVVAVPDSVHEILQNACFDCHSNNTEYPWYSNIQPVSWWLNNHIEDGKGHLNFNEFANIMPRNGKTTKERQLKKLEEINDEVKEGEMPLKSYLLMHKEARLTESQKQMIANWVTQASNKLESAPEK